jgi:membrane protease YdiL (CAAX protease family)
VAVVVVGALLSAALLGLGGLLYRAVLSLEAHGALPQHALRDALARWGIGWQTFLVAVSGALIYGAFLLAVWVVVVRGAPHTGWASLGLRPVPLGAFALVIPVYLVTLLVAGLATALETSLVLHGHLTNPQQAIFVGAQGSSTVQFLLFFAVVCLLGPLVEELLFRGMLYQLLRRNAPLWAAVGLSAGLFALAHAIPVLLPPLFIFGVALALVFEYTRSLYCSIFLHVLINSVAVYVGLSAR